MNLERGSLVSAIRAGLRRSSGQGPDIQAAAIMDAVDLLIEIQSGVEDRIAVPPTEPKDPPILPPNPRAIEISPAAVSKFSPPSRIIHGTDQATTTAIQEHRQAQGLRVKRTFLGGSKNRVGLIDLSKWAQGNFPLTIQVTPVGYTEPVELERNVYTMPLMGEQGGREKESTVKVVYKHPKMDSTMEVGSGMRVGDFQDAWPDVNEHLNVIRNQARELYKRRGQMIEGREPKGPPLEQQHRSALSIQDRIYKRTSELIGQGIPQEQAHARATDEVRAGVQGRSGRPLVITLADAE